MTGAENETRRKVLEKAFCALHRAEKKIKWDRDEEERQVAWREDMKMA